MLLARSILHPTNKPSRLLNPIPQTIIEQFKTNFLEGNALQINTLTILLPTDHLTPCQWQSTCTSLDHIIQNISDLLIQKCSAPPLPQLTNRTN